VQHEGRTRYVHHLACEAEHGPRPSPQHEVAHSCGRGHEGCVNRKHLRWATRSENQMDRVKHGTHNRGERHGMSRLTEHQAREALRLRGLISQEAIAERFGVSRGAICRIHQGRGWAWL
jgi:hypothetical protein